MIRTTTTRAWACSDVVCGTRSCSRRERSRDWSRRRWESIQTQNVFSCVCVCVFSLFSLTHTVYFIIIEGKAHLIRAVPPSERKALTARSSDEVDLHSIVGTRTRITVDDSSDVVASAQGGYFCNVCQVAIKDSNTYLDHINSQRHLAASGIASRAVKSTVADIRRRLRQPPGSTALLLQGGARGNMRTAATASTVAATRKTVVEGEKDEDEERTAASTVATTTTTTTTTSTIATALDTEREQGDTPGEQRGGGVKDGSSDGQDDEMMRILGFSGFTSSKK